jgi:hypothetical protein
MVCRVAHYNRKVLPAQLNDGVAGEAMVALTPRSFLTIGQR